MLFIKLSFQRHHNRQARSGFTLVELLIAIAVFAIVVPVMVTFFSTVIKNFTSFEATNQLKKTNQESLNRIHLKLKSCKRIFTRADGSYVVKISTSEYPGLSASKLPNIEVTGSLVPGNAVFISSNAGNSLLFANNDSTQILENVQDAGAVNRTVYIDLYRFNYYYLSTKNPKTIFDKPSCVLMEWRSVRYADWNQLVSSTDTIKITNTVIALRNSGILYSWNPSASSATGFFTLGGSGVITSSATHQIQRDKYKILTQMTTGIMGGGYRYGISPNSAGWGRAPKVVPVYATASGNFPSGFEVVIVGSAGARKVLVRSVLVAQGSMKSILADERLIISSARDLW